MKNVLFMKHEELTSHLPSACSKSNGGLLIMHTIFPHQAAFYFENKPERKIVRFVTIICFTTLIFKSDNK